MFQCYLQDIDLELAALEEGNRNRQAELSAYAELDNIAEEDEQEPPGWYIFRIICRDLSLRSMFRHDCDETNAQLDCNFT